MIILREYQQDLHDKTVEALRGADKVLVICPTGGGKSILISQLASKLPGRTLVLTHREEILHQNSAWISGCFMLNAKVRKIPSNIDKIKVVASMSQTLAARIKKYGIDYVGRFDNIISDEVHVNYFEKVYSQYDFKRLIGYTATPITGRKEVKEVDDPELGPVEFIRPYPLSNDFDCLVEGVTEKDLIDLGYLTQDFNVALRIPGMEKLVKSESTPDGYTSNSLNEVYGNEAALDILWEAYEKHGKGKKTMIFNSTTKINVKVHEFFESRGTDCQVFDSVNKNEMSRKEVIEWFRSKRDAVLINCNVFTTGFDVTDVETIILNRATQSLSLFLQMVGRGSRITDIIYKDKFTVIDLGGNFAKHDIWSAKRDWTPYFKGRKWKMKQTMDEMQFWRCKSCDYFNEPGTTFCEEREIMVCGRCGKPKPLPKDKNPRTGELVYLEKPKPPSAKGIIEYTKKIGGNSTTAFKILESQIIDLFVQHEVNQAQYVKDQGRFKKRVADIYRPVYFAIIRDDELKGKRRKYQTQIENIFTKIDERYED